MTDHNRRCFFFCFNKEKEYLMTFWMESIELFKKNEWGQSNRFKLSHTTMQQHHRIITFRSKPIIILSKLNDGRNKFYTTHIIKMARFRFTRIVVFLFYFHISNWLHECESVNAHTLFFFSLNTHIFVSSKRLTVFVSPCNLINQTNTNMNND